LSLDKKKYIEDIFRTIGHLKEIKEDEMDSFTALFGSGPAYIMYFIEALIDSEEFSSISKEDKSLLILHLLSSTSKMLFITEDIKELRSKVTSKGGTTEAAIKTLEDNNFSKILKKAINNARRKSLEISK
jgi:pyrroline-5-carboxylate reductase